MHRFFRKRSLLQSQKLLRRERACRYAKIIFIFLFFCGFLWGLSALSYYSKLTVQTVLVSGNSAISTDEILKVVHDELQGRNFLIFSRANILWYPKKQIIDKLQYSFSWIDTVSVARVNSTTIEIKIKERVPVAVWCGVDQEKPVPCQLIDMQGYAFAKAPEFSGAVYIKLYGPITSTNWRGSKFFSQNGFVHMLDFAKALPEIGLQPVASAVVGDNTYNMFLSEGAYISVQVSDPISEIISNIDSLLSQKVFMQSKTSNFSNLLYIDARFGNKLFYKFK